VLEKRNHDTDLRSHEFHPIKRNGVPRRCLVVIDVPDDSLDKRDPMLKGLVDDIFLLRIVADGERFVKGDIFCIIFQAQNLPSKSKLDIDLDNLAWRASIVNRLVMRAEDCPFCRAQPHLSSQISAAKVSIKARVLSKRTERSGRRAPASEGHLAERGIAELFVVEAFAVDDGDTLDLALCEDLAEADGAPPFCDLGHCWLGAVGVVEGREVFEGEVVEDEDVDVDWDALRGRELHCAQKGEQERAGLSRGIYGLV